MKSLSQQTAAENRSAILKLEKQRKVERRVLAYIKKVIANSGRDFCCIPQAYFSKALKVRKETIRLAVDNLILREELIRISGENGNRKNSKFFYLLPKGSGDGEPIGAPIGAPNNQILNPPIFFKEEEKVKKIRNEADLREIEKWNSMSRLELIESYLDSGLMITPLVAGNKIPPYGWDKKLLISKSKEELLDYFVAKPLANVGAWMPANLVAVDIDDLELFAEHSGGAEFVTLTSSSGRGIHYWFRNDGEVGSGNGIRKALDFKTNGSLMVLPPSIHKSGRPYEWLSLTEPEEAPQLIKDFYRTRENLRNPQTVPVHTSNGIAPAVAVAAGVTEISGSRCRVYLPSFGADVELHVGSRYNYLFQQGRKIRRRVTEQQLIQELAKINLECCKPPLDNRRFQNLIRDVQNGSDRPEYLKKTAKEVSGLRD